MSSLSRKALILVADARKAVFLSNDGDETHPNLVVVSTIVAPDNPPAREHASDRPGRTGYRGVRSAVGQSDGHELAETEFAGKVVEALSELHSKREKDAVIIAAPPRFLSDIRAKLPAGVQRRIVLELHKDMTHMPVAEIEQALSGK